MKKTSLMRRLVGLGFALLILTANLTIADTMSMNEAARSESQDGAIRTKVCGADGDLPLYKYSYALVIGESNYLAWPKLPGAKADVDAVEIILKDHGFVVKKLMNPTLAEFNDAIKEFKEKHDRLYPSRFLLYFSGHGYTEMNP